MLVAKTQCIGDENPVKLTNLGLVLATQVEKLWEIVKEING